MACCRYMVVRMAAKRSTLLTKQALCVCIVLLCLAKLAPPRETWRSDVCLSIESHSGAIASTHSLLHLLPVQAWRNGGYSDDMLLAAKCSEAKLAIAAPSHALFAQWLPQYVSLGAYWNYLRRQLVVLDTYSSEHNRRLNHTMMIVHAWASAMLALGCTAALVQLFMNSRSVAGYLLTNLMGLRLRTRAGGMPCERDTQGCACSFDHNECSISSSTSHLYASWSLWLLLASMALAQLGMYLNAQQSVLLLHALSPHMAHGSMAAGMHLFSWLHVWGGLLFESLVLPPCMLWTYCHSDIEWSGLRYRKCNGRVRTLVATNNCIEVAQ